MKEHLFTYRTRHGSWDDIWARDVEHAREILMARTNRPNGFYTICRVSNVPPREVSNG